MWRPSHHKANGHKGWSGTPPLRSGDRNPPTRSAVWPEPGVHNPKPSQATGNIEHSPSGYAEIREWDKVAESVLPHGFNRGHGSVRDPKIEGRDTPEPRGTRPEPWDS